MRRNLSIISLLTVLAIFFLPSSASSALNPEPDELHIPHFSELAITTTAYSGASSWAVVELDKAVEYGLITNRIKNNMAAKVTREEFAEIALKLYEKYTGKTASQGNIHFSDTSNPEILKAANLGIITGVGGNQYAPSELVTREQMATILFRAMKVISPAVDYQTEGAAVFADDNKVESWAREGVYYCYKVQIVKGVGKTNGADRFDPDGNATREQAVLVSLRVYESLSGKSSAVGTGTDAATTSGAHPSQSKLSLPKGFPKSIPFTDDAYNVAKEASEGSIFLQYESDKKLADLVTLYRNFIKQYDSDFQVTKDETYSVFMAEMPDYELTLMIADVGNITVSMTLNFPEGIPDEPEDDRNTVIAGIDESEVTDGTAAAVTNQEHDGELSGHYAKTDYSDGIIDASGVSNPNAMIPSRLVAGSACTDPYSTNLFIRKDDKSLWGFGNDLYTGAVQGAYGWKSVNADATWTMIDQGGYCLGTQSTNYYVLKSDKSLWSYGSNDSSLLGNGEAYLYGDYPPAKILDNVRTANIGQNGIAVKTDNTLWIWGFSGPVFSVLEQTESDRLVPEKVLDNVVDAVQSASLDYYDDGLIMVLKIDGSVWTWGEGNCGDGGVTPGRTTPIKVMNGVKKIEASHSLCCMIKNDNSLWVWQAHETNSGLKQSLLRPAKIMDNVREVSPGVGFLIALKIDGTVWAYGDNTYGRCGVGKLTPEYLSSPVKILDGVVEISATDQNAFALLKDGRIMGWGLNDRTHREGDFDWLDTDEWRILKPTDVGITAK